MNMPDGSELLPISESLNGLGDKGVVFLFRPADHVRYDCPRRRVIQPRARPFIESVPGIRVRSRVQLPERVRPVVQHDALADTVAVLDLRRVGKTHTEMFAGERM